MMVTGNSGGEISSMVKRSSMVYKFQYNDNHYQAKKQSDYESDKCDRFNILSRQISV
jgi:hypothetical protein